MINTNDQIKKILGLVVQEGIELAAIQLKAKKDSWKWWLAEGAKRECEDMIALLAPMVTPSDIPEGATIKIDKVGNVIEKEEDANH